VRWANGPAHVHGGFLRALDSVWKDISAELDRLNCPLFFTGHSLGGALASLAGMRRAPTATYTFGSPRVGDAAFVALAAGMPIYRIVDDRDVVASVPPYWLGFRHIGALTTVQESGVGEPEGDAEGDANGGPPRFLADHAPINYVDRVRGFVDQGL
jgi:hypothetical protein